MKSIYRHLTAVIMSVTLIQLVVSAHTAAGHSGAMLGSTASAGAAMRTIDLSAGPRSVSVNQGDIITFTTAGKSFTWQFDTLRPDANFKLAEIAPRDFDTRDAWVYVAPHPLYRN